MMGIMRGGQTKPELIDSTRAGDDDNNNEKGKGEEAPSSVSLPCMLHQIDFILFYQVYMNLTHTIIKVLKWIANYLST